MKITKVEPILVSLPFENGVPKPRVLTGAFRESVQTLYVRIETDEGLTGWGEAFGASAAPLTIPAIADILGPQLVGHDPSGIADLTSQLKQRFQSMMRGGPARFALSGIDIALWDLKGKMEGSPIWRLLGGEGKARIAAYASMPKLNEADTVKQAHIAAERGYRAIKLHDKTVEGVAAARAVLGPDFPLMVDANCAWGAERAIAIAHALRPYDPAWLEEPVSPSDDYEALARVRSEGGLPIANGETLGNPNDAKWMAAAGAADILQPSAVKHGGISDVMTMIAIARDADLRVALHSPFVGPGLLAAVHILAATGNMEPCEHRYCTLGANPMGEFVLARDGWLHVPQGAGLGAEPDPETLARYRVS